MIEVLVPRENVNDDEVVILSLNVESGSEIFAGQVIMEIETSKTNIEVEAPESGIIHFTVAEGDEISVGEVMCRISNDETDSLKPLTDDIVISNEDTSTGSFKQVSKSAVDAAEKYGVDINLLQGPWVSVRDVMVAAQMPISDTLVNSKLNTPQPLSGGSIADKPNDLPAHVTEKIDLRKRSEVLSLSVFGSELRQSTIGISTPILTKRLTQPIPLFEDGISDLVVYEASRLLKQFPLLNSFYESKKSFGLYEEVHAGISFDNDRNLKVLRVKNSDRLKLDEVQVAINSLFAKFEAEENLTDELKPATFTVTDLTNTSVSFMHPLLNGYQCLIVGIVRSSVKNRYQLIASFDHRVSEGLYVAKFLDALVQNVSSHFIDSVTGVANVRCHFCQKSMQEERSLGNRGFINVTIESGDQVEICRNCFDGW